MNCFQNKIRRALSKLCVAAALSIGFIFAPQVGNTIGFQNCTGDDIRVHIYNGKDSAQIVAKHGGKISAGTLKKWNVGKKKHTVKVFQAKIVDKMQIGKGNLNGNWDYRIIRHGNGDWSLVPAGHPVKACPN